MPTRFALSTGSVPLEEAFDFAVTRGITALEFACQELVNQPQTFDSERISRVRTLMDRSGIDGVLHTASSVNSAEIVPSVRVAVEDYLLGYIDLTERLGCSTMIVHGGFYFDLDLEARLDSLCMTLQRCAREAEGRGISLAIENMNVLPVEAEIRYLGCTAAEILAILDAVDSPALTACVDLGHANLLPEGAGEFVDRLSGRIGHVQLTDNNGVIDDHLALGEGTLDIVDVVARVTAGGYSGPVAIELSDRGAQDRSLERLKRLGLWETMPTPV